MKKIFSIFMSVLLLLLSLSVANAAEKVTLRVYTRYWGELLKGMEKLVASFEKLHPEIDIKIENVPWDEYRTKLDAMIAAKVAPDIIFPTAQWTFAYGEQGILPLNDFIKADKFNIDRYFKQVMDCYILDGKVYGLPNDMAAYAIFYNKDMFDKAGVAYPQDNWTYDDFLSTAQKLTKDFNGDGRIDQFGGILGTGDITPIVASFTGKQVFDNMKNPKKFLYSEPDAIEALQFIADLVWKYHVSPRPQESAQMGDLFMTGKTAMIRNGHWMIPDYKTIKSFKWGIAPLPVKKFVANVVDGSCWSITTSSKHPKEAWEFVKYICGPVGQKLFMINYEFGTPTLKAVAFSKEWQFSVPGCDKKAFLNAVLTKGGIGTINYGPLTRTGARIQDEFLAGLDPLWLGQKSAKDTIEELAPKIEKLLTQ